MELLIGLNWVMIASSIKMLINTLSKEGPVLINYLISKRKFVFGIYFVCSRFLYFCHSKRTCYL